jgi:hypothetical protein
MSYIEEPLFFNGGFVRSIVMRFFKGNTLLNPKWTDLIKQASNSTNGTNFTSLDNFPEGIMVGSPILKEIMPPFEPGMIGVSDDQYFSTMVEVLLFVCLY